jgi:hypothetical protein
LIDKSPSLKLKLASVKLTQNKKNVNWQSRKKLRDVKYAEMHEFEITTNNNIIPFWFKERFGVDKGFERSKQTLLAFTSGGEVTKFYIVRYYYSGMNKVNSSIKNAFYDDLGKEWEGEVAVYSLDETHIVSFDVVYGQVMKTKSYSTTDPSKNFISANMTCIVLWHPGPCEYISQGIKCYDTFETICYSTAPPSGGIGGSPVYIYQTGGSGGSPSGPDENQFDCEAWDLNCVPYTGVVNPADLISGYNEPFQSLFIDPNPGILDFQTTSESRKLGHILSHIKKAKSNNIASIDVRSIFSNWPSYLLAGEPIKPSTANIYYNGQPIRIRFEYPVVHPWSVIRNHLNIDNQHSSTWACKYIFRRVDGNLVSGAIYSPDYAFCAFLEGLL